MAETVLSMARSVLDGAISKAASAAADEMSLLMGVRKDIWFIKDELETMQAFLVAAEAMKDKDMLLKVWAKQIRDMSYNIEDCLGEFMVHVASQSLSRKLMKLKDRHRIAMQIRDLKSRVEEVSSRNTRYNLIEKNQITRAIDERDSCMEDIRNQSGSNIDEAELVGFSKPKQKLIKLMDLHVMNGPAQVVCVVGMGGLGKTTITRKVYETMKDFSCCAWITVSQSFVRMELLKVMIKQLFGENELKKQLEGNIVREEDFANYLRKGLLDKRYIVVLDDLWNIDHWKWIKSIAFPSSNSKGSRIMVTTRDVGLAKECILEPSRPLIYHHEPLETQDAIHLLIRKAMKSEEDMKNDEKMRKIVAKIVNKSGRLPLAILTIGGMLATKVVTEWESIYNQIPSELETNISLQAMRRMVTLSYNHLPSHLKSCFLYLSIFPEDSEIKRRHLVERWIAEGFVRAKDGVNIQNVGISYFMELINRSMIQPSKVNIEGDIKSCRVHDIMRDVMVSIAKDENFVCVARDVVTSAVKENFRHVAYHGSKCQNIGIDWSHVRSITLFGDRPVEPSPSLCSPDLRMLRALDLEDAHFKITQKDINNIGSLRHLKYVNLGCFVNRGFANIYKLPRSIGKLQFLQTLDIRNSYISTLPNEISKLQCLLSLRCTRKTNHSYFDRDRPKRCLKNTLTLPMTLTPFVDADERANKIAELHMACSSRCSMSKGVSIPKGFSNLKVLHVLEVVDVKRTSSKAITELGELKRLSKLGVLTNGATEKKCKILCEAIEKLPSLRSLRVVGFDYRIKSVGKLDWLHFVSSPPPLMRSLKLHGFLGEMPDWIGSLMHLVKIYLYGSELKGGKTMELLGTLPNLMLLDLGGDAYAAEKLVFGEGAFQNLRKLEFYYSSGLREVRFEEGTSPHMEKIQFSSCRLESGILGVKHLPKLTEISLGYDSKVARLDALQGEVDAHPNRPVLRLNTDRSYHDLGEVVQGSTARLQDEAAIEEREESSLHPDPAAAGESSSSQVVVVPTQSNSQDSEDDFCSCNSDDDDNDDDG